MRKNGVNRELREISGGVCAPSGFSANGIACGIKQEGEDLALILSDKRCPTACVFSCGSAQSSTATVSKKHLKYGVARAIIANSGKANLLLPNGERLAETVCRTLAKHCNLDANEVVIASTGKVDGTLTLSPFEKGIPALCKGLTADEEGSLRAARAIMTTDKTSKQVAYEFDLGDFPCKIGAIFKGSARVCPNMATMLAFLTTDINISPEMLQKALSTAVKDSFNLLWLDGISSPNDTVCIMANGRAGNYKISYADSEYDKFVYALREVLTQICIKILQENGDILFFAKATGANSKQTAREIARKLVGAQAIKKSLQQGVLDCESILYTAASSYEDMDGAKCRVWVESNAKKIILFDEGRALAVKPEHFLRILETEKVTVGIHLGEGNYNAQAFGIIPK
ncbi:MAG: bifunctional ornithine acetyltransferase/N-acetylglutamate synthase [Clostridia bacterium]|nr:bifunctional ornithine acetyltransferase/N-acetylglutamate synthase [Clostridia bacterium]